VSVARPATIVEVRAARPPSYRAGAGLGGGLDRIVADPEPQQYLCSATLISLITGSVKDQPRQL